MVNKFLTQNALRLKFSDALSLMYQKEVPNYKTLLKLVQDINQSDDIRLNRERHGAIRIGLPHELRFLKNLFAAFGMKAVKYYDLGIAGMPVHSTAFRPIEIDDLEFCPFRIFTSLLKIDFIQDDTIKNKVISMLQKRNFVPSGLDNLITKAIHQNGLDHDDAEKFIELSLQVFAHNPNAITDYEIYEELKKIHPLIADIVCFATPHLNHLTPRTTDIDLLQSKMRDYNLDPKAIIEGPPKRKIPILLRQTAFKAIAEPVTFMCGTKTKHTARFGEIEQRGYHLTPKGYALYNDLLSQVNQKITVKLDGSNKDQYYAILEETFQKFPDDIDILKQQNLLQLDDKGEPQIYEDFLPVSAAGIFSANLGDSYKSYDSDNQYDLFCQYLGCVPLNSSL